MQCPACHTQNAPGVVQCVECGATLPDEQRPEPPTSFGQAAQPGRHAYRGDDLTREDPESRYTPPRPWEPDAPQPWTSAPEHPETRADQPSPWTPETEQPWQPESAGEQTQVQPWEPGALAQPPAAQPWEPGTLAEPTSAQPWQTETPGEQTQVQPWEPEAAGETQVQPWEPGTLAEPKPWEHESPGERTHVQPWEPGAMAEPAPAQPWGPGEQHWQQQPGGGVVPPPMPEPWQPPPVRRRNRTGQAIVAAWVIVVVAAIAAVAIAFWPTGKSANKAAHAVTPAGGPSSSAAPSTQTSTAGGDAQTQATAINTLLDGMATTRSELSQAVTDAQDCSGISGAVPAIQKAVGDRAAQLGTAKSLQVGALDNGDKLKEALTSAVQASLDADNLYLKWANDNQGCSGTTPEDSDFTQAGVISQTRAGPAKTEFLTYWAPVAQQQGLPARDRDHI